MPLLVSSSIVSKEPMPEFSAGLGSNGFEPVPVLYWTRLTSNGLSHVCMYVFFLLELSGFGAHWPVF